MNLEKIIYGFFMILALTLNVSFVVGDISNPGHHSVWLLFATLLVSLVTTLLKMGDRSQIGAIFLSASLVANLQLIIAVTVWAVAEGGMDAPLGEDRLVTILSLATGALVANIVSVMILVTDTLMLRR